MKFSFNLIKKLAPGKYAKAELVERMNLYSFEATDLGGDVLDIVIPPNRYSDAASHLGLARETAAIMNLKNVPYSDFGGRYFSDARPKGAFAVKIKNNKLCRRYLAALATDVKIGPSPKWIRETLESCGLRSVNNVVDIMNYVMLETGQPLHAFDADKVSEGIIVRTAKAGESIETIDGNTLSLSPDILVIADIKSPLAIAGIKGGKFSEVTPRTKRILVESANFDSAGIYRASRKLGLVTDASLRFSHNLSPELAAMGMRRALQLLKELAGAKVYEPIDEYPKKQSKKIMKLDVRRLNNLIGRDFTEKEIWKILTSLGFGRWNGAVEVPPLRADIQGIEDLAEEVVRIFGYEKLPAEPPRIALGAAVQDGVIILKDKIRGILSGLGYSEVYNYSFLDKKSAGLKAISIANPISEQFSYLRDSLEPGLLKNIADNRRFSETVRIFEIGNVFFGSAGAVREALNLGLAAFGGGSYLELKGIVDLLLKRLGITDFDFYIEGGDFLSVKVSDKVIGGIRLASQARGVAVVEISLPGLLKEINEEQEYRPLSKFPSIIRDLSIFAPAEIRVGEILGFIQRISPKLVSDIDLIDFYEPSPEEKRKGLTFRIVFQAEDRTLTDAEADKELKIIIKAVAEKFDAEIR